MRCSSSDFTIGNPAASLSPQQLASCFVQDLLPGGAAVLAGLAGSVCENTFWGNWKPSTGTADRLWVRNVLSKLGEQPGSI